MSAKKIGPFCVVCRRKPLDGPALCVDCRAEASRKVRGWNVAGGQVDLGDLIVWVAGAARAHASRRRALGGRR